VAGFNGLDPTETHFFWADDRPGLGFLFRDFGLVPQTAFNQPMRLSVYRNMDFPDFFLAEIVVQPQFIFFCGVSFGNSMAPNAAEIGFELEGTTGAAADHAHFTEIEFGYLFDHSSYVIFPPANDAVRVDPPVDAGWQVAPSQSRRVPDSTPCAAASDRRSASEVPDHEISMANPDGGNTPGDDTVASGRRSRAYRRSQSPSEADPVSPARRHPQLPQGSAAIKPQTRETPSFTLDDVKEFVATHMPLSTSRDAQFSVTRAECMTASR
jgi:hypothetical protein